MKNPPNSKIVLKEIFILFMTLLYASPFYLIIVNSLKSTKEVYSNPFGVPQSIRLETFIDVLMGAGISANFINGLFVSSFITIGSLFFLVVLGSLAAYGLARNPGKIRDILYISFVVQIIIPSQLGIVPIYTFMLKIGIAGSIGGMIILYTFKQMPMTIFLYTGFFQSFPFNFEEAAMIDGATWKQAFMKIVMPQMNTITGTVLLMNSIYIWNDTFDQIVFLSGTQHQTLPVLIYTLTTQMTAQWNIIFAAVIISLLPMLLLYLFTQKKMIASFAGGIKG